MNELLEFLFLPIINGLILTLTAAWVTAPVALLVLLLDRLANRRMSARVHCWLWLLVAVRLLMPIAPGSPVSVQHLWELLPRENALQANYPSRVTQETVESPSETLSDFLASETPAVLSKPTSHTPGVSASFREWDVIGISMVALVWLTGVLFVLFRALVASLRFARRLSRIPDSEDDFTIGLVSRVCEQIGVRCRLRVKYVPGLAVPALFGLWRPTLCLPEETKESLNRDQLRMIVLHEAMHLRRGDGYTAWLLTLVRALHWFNPVAWYTVRQVEIYRELACDNAVRQFTHPQERHVYMDLLLQFASDRPAASLGLLGLWFASPTKNLSARLEAFTDRDKNRRRLPRLVSGVLILLLGIVGLTDAANVEVMKSITEPKQPVFFVGPSDDGQVLPPHVRGDQVDAVEEREYDLTAALEKMNDVPVGQNPKERLLIWAKVPGSHSMTFRTNEDNPHRVTITMPRSRHAFFAKILDEICRVGHVSQVVVEAKVMSSEHVEKMVRADWMGAVKFASPESSISSQWSESKRPTEAQEISLSMETVSFEYAPYTALILDENKMAQLIGQFQKNEQASLIRTPKITLFSGQSAMLSDKSYSPFVTGVEYIQGEFATAAQPNVTVIPEGLQMDVQPLVLDDGTIDLRCRLTLYSIDRVGQAKLPGAEVTVQTPQATRRTVTARCRLKQGETLLVAPLAGKHSGKQKTHYYAISAYKISEQGE